MAWERDKLLVAYTIMVEEFAQYKAAHPCPQPGLDGDGRVAFCCCPDKP